MVKPFILSINSIRFFLLNKNISYFMDELGGERKWEEKVDKEEGKERKMIVGKDGLEKEKDKKEKMV